MVRLSILICHNAEEPDRKVYLDRLLYRLQPQLSQAGKKVEVNINRDTGSIGSKRNSLLQNAKGEYVAFIDDDDDVAEEYVEYLLEGIRTGRDCCSLRGLIDEKIDFNMFEHSIRHEAYATVNPDKHDGVKYLRYPNHLNCIKSEIAKQFKFPLINHGEDTDWATQIKNSGLIKTEYWIDEPIYFYYPSSNRK